MRQAFRDPDSVKWRDIYVGGMGYLCGTVNAKNGMGGYTGFQVFYAMPTSSYPIVIDEKWRDEGHTTEESGNHSLYSTWKTQCVDYKRSH